MANIKPESKMLDDVRRWRSEAFEARARQTSQQRLEEDRRLTTALGLREMNPADLVQPRSPAPIKRAG